MRIAQVAPLAESVPPKLYGGTERVVSWLTEELVALGHDVTLFASGVRDRAKLVPIVPRALRLSRPHGDPASAYAILLDEIHARVADFDVIHCHIDWVHLPVLRRLHVPFLTTLIVVLICQPLHLRYGASATLPLCRSRTISARRSPTSGGSILSIMDFRSIHFRLARLRTIISLS